MSTISVEQLRELGLVSKETVSGAASVGEYNGVILIVMEIGHCREFLSWGFKCQ